jgi:hypothetical protein
LVLRKKEMAEEEMAGMERQVAQFASRLLSRNPLEMLEAQIDLSVLRESCVKNHELRYFSRLVQELAIYKQASFIQTLLKQALLYTNAMSSLDAANQASLEGTLEICRAFASFSILTKFASRKAVAQYCVRSQEVAQRLVEICRKNLPRKRIPERSMASIQIWDPDCGLEGLCNFARASKLIREEMRISADLLPSLEYLLSAEYAGQVDRETCLGSRKTVAKLVEALTMWEDRRSWMIELGYVKLLADVYRTAHLQQDEVPTTAASFALIRLRACPMSTELMKAHGVHRFLKPHSKIIDSISPGFWKDLERRILAGVEDGPRALKAYKDSAKITRCMTYVTPTVCSWGGCTLKLGFEMDAIKFKKCARCSIAHYCR